jgi:hypothetical protein
MCTGWEFSDSSQEICVSFDVDYSSSAVTGTPKSASKIPLIISISVTVISTAIYFIFPHDGLTMAIIGYLLTPIGATLALALGQSLDVSGRRSVWYSPSKGLITALKALAIFGFIIGGLHMWDVATIVAAA